MSKQRVEVLVIGAGRHKQKIQAAIFDALEKEFSEAAKWSFPDRSTFADLVGSARELSLSLQVLAVSIDNDQLDSPPQESGEYWRKQLSTGVASSKALQGFTTGRTIDPLESAISSVASDAESADGVTLLVLQEHLKSLCALQLQALKAAAHSKNDGVPRFDRCIKGHSGPEIQETGPSREFRPIELPSYLREYLEGIHWHIKKAVDAIEKGGKPTEPA